MVGQSAPPTVVVSSQVTAFTLDPIAYPNPDITKAVVDTKGDIIFVNKDQGGIYELPANGGPAITLGNAGGGYSNGGIAIDAQNNLYLSNNWSANFIKVPYANGTWNLASGTTFGGATAAMGYWYAGNDLTIDPAGNIYVALANGTGIWKYDTSGNFTLLVSGLANDPQNIAVDANGNVYFSDQSSASVWRIPAGTTGLTNGVASLTAIGTGLTKPSGVSVDAAGNVYIADSTAQLIVEVPNENGTPNNSHQMVLASISASGPVAIAPQGNLVATTGGGITKILLGNAAVGSGPVGGTGATPGKVFLGFNAPVTLGNPVLTADGAASSDFTVASTSTCTAGSSYTANQTCELDVAISAQIVGSVSGKLSVRDNTGNELATAYVNGVGQGPGLGIAPAAQSNFAAGFKFPMQTAVDRLGNVFVADSTNGTVLKFAQGTGSGVAVGTGLSAPTGVAVDSFGNVFIADSGDVIKVPFDGSAQSTVATGLNNGKNIAVDGAGNVYVAVADSSNGRVLMITQNNPLLPNGAVVSVGSFSQPTGVAVDGSGNVFVVDAGNNTLSEISASSGQTTITNTLQSPVAVAVDASGSVYVAQSSGVTRIPNEKGTFNVNDAVSAATGVVTATGVALDTIGNLYISDSGAPAVLLVSTNSTLNLGEVNVSATSAPLNALLFNMGNQPLTFTSPLYDALGPDAADFQVAASANDGCAPANQLAPGTVCGLTVTFAPVSAAGDRSDVVQIQSNAANSSTTTISLAGRATASNPTILTLAVVSPTGTATYPVAITLSATVAPKTGSIVPSGTVTFIVDGVAQQPVSLTNGTVQTTLTNLNSGQHVFGASFSGDDADNLASSFGQQLTVTVQQATSATTLTPLAQYTQIGTAVSLAATVTSTGGTPTGTVTFMDGTTSLGSSPVDAKGNASLTTATTLTGTHTFTASYSGDVNFLTSQSAPTTTDLINPTIQITASPSSITVAAGSTATTTLTLSSIAGFSDTANLSCVQATLPANAVCAFSHFSTVSPVAPGAAQTTLLTIMTNVSTTTTQAKSSVGGLWMASTFAVGMAGLVFGKRKKFSGRILSFGCVLLLLFAVAGFSSCGSPSANKAPINTVTPAGTTLVTVQAVSKTTTPTTYVSLPFQISVTVK